MSVKCPKCGWTIYQRGDSQKLEEVKRQYPKMSQAWSPEDDKKLQELRVDLDVADMSQILQRPPTAIRRRMEILGEPKRAKPEPQGGKEELERAWKEKEAQDQAFLGGESSLDESSST